MTRPKFTIILTLLILTDLGLCGLLIRSYFSIRTAALIPAATPNIMLAVENPPDVESLRLRFVGDIMLGRSVNLSMIKAGDYRWPFTAAIPKLPPVDFFIANLESPITDPCPPVSTGMVFCTPTQAVEGLTYAGINMVSLANNHTLNHGKKGLSQTQQLLDQAGIRHLIHGQYQSFKIKDINLGVIAFDDITYPLTHQQVSRTISNLPEKPEVLLAYLHWGNEYQASPSARQRQIAGWLNEAGVQLIIGSHPHVVQPIEQPIENQLIAYSLGNFVFDQMWSEPTRKGMILDLNLEFTDHRLFRISHREYPFTIYDFGQPRLSN